MSGRKDQPKQQPSIINKPQNNIQRDGNISQANDELLWHDQTNDGPNHPTLLLNAAPFYGRQDSGVSEGGTDSLASLRSTVSIKSCDSGLGLSSMGSPATTPISPLPFSLLTTVNESVDFDEIHVHQYEKETEDTSSNDLTPTNSPKSSITSTSVPLTVITPDGLPYTSLPFASSYNDYVNTFFNLFVNGLHLREDTVYPAFNVESVTALGFGVKNNRVVPCIRVYTELSSDSERLALLCQVAQNIISAVKEFLHVNLSLDECLEYLEIDDTKNTIFYPEELMGAPGDQFKIPGGALNGTLGYFMKCELTVASSEDSLGYTTHFGITCAHCALPVKTFWAIIDDTNEDKTVSNQYNRYPIKMLYDCMWQHSRHSSFLSFLLSKKSCCNGVAYYSEYTPEQEACFIKASVCSEGMRNVVRKWVTYEDCEGHQQGSQGNKYSYVLSKFGMIPSGFFMPLPYYLFRSCNGDKHFRDKLYHLPFNVDIGVLEVNDEIGVIDHHCLDSVLPKYSSYKNVNGIFVDGSTCIRKDKLSSDLNFPSKVGPTSGAVPHHIINTEKPINTSQDTSFSKGVSSNDYTKLSSPQQELIKDTDVPWHSSFSPGFLINGTQKMIRTVKASCRNIFSFEEQEELYLHVMSRQSTKNESRPIVRSLKVKNDEFCIEFIHRNPRKKNQYRSFPAVKWNWKTSNTQNEKNFIVRGDSGSSLFLVNKNELGEEQQVLLGVVCSTNTASRIDFIKEIIAPDLFLYMSSKLLANNKCTNSMKLICEQIQKRVRLVDQLLIASEENQEVIHQKLQDIRLLMKAMEGTYHKSSISVTFKLTECIQNCTAIVP